MKYGLPYKGSKNKLAERIVDFLPKRDHLIDLFCGGCAVSHAALLTDKFPHIHINDENWMCPQLFLDALAGKYKDECRWVSREEFHRLKTTDPYVAMVWSFGNNMRDYLYSADIEPLKRAIHYAMFFRDYQPADELGFDLRFLDGITDIHDKYIKVKDFFRNTQHPRCQHFEGGVRLRQIGERRAYNRHPCALKVGGGTSTIADRQNCKILKPETELHRLQYMERNRSMQFQPSTITPDRITSSVLDYEQVYIPDDSVIYCDPPYAGTDAYKRDKGNQFDYPRFYDWCCRQAQPVFISSYHMPADRFELVKAFSHRCTLSPTANNQVYECIFIPKGQKERGEWKEQRLF